MSVTALFLRPKQHTPATPTPVPPPKRHWKVDSPSERYTHLYHFILFLLPQQFEDLFIHSAHFLHYVRFKKCLFCSLGIASRGQETKHKV